MKNAVRWLGTLDVLMAGVWTIFPHVSIASFNGGGTVSILLPQRLLPGDKPDELGNKSILSDGKRAK